MANIATIDICRKDLFTPVEELQKEYTEAQVARVLRLRDMYNWVLANPDNKALNPIDFCLIQMFVNL